jgi:hypothetical protein
VRRIPAARASAVIETQVKDIRGDEVSPGDLALLPPKTEEDQDDDDYPAEPEDTMEDIEGAVSNMLQTASTWTYVRLRYCVPDAFSKTVTPIGGSGRAVGYDTSAAAGGRPSRTHSVPPPQYICHRCRQPGHLINHCPTNGDPRYDFVRVKHSTGIPKTFLVPVSADEASSPGTLLTPGGGLAKVAPNEYVSSLFCC